LKYNKRIASVLIAGGILLCLLQIWLPAYFLSGDGPCHLANARIIHNMLCGEQVGFYTKFYNLNLHPHPNWLTHILLALLMFVFNGLMAEKVLLTLYVAVMVLGLHLLLRRLNGVATYWVAVLFVFVFHNLVAQGFYNFSYSVAFYCLLVYSWVNYLEKRHIAGVLYFFLYLVLVYFSHPVAFVFGGVTCVSLSITYFLARQERGNNHQLARVLLALVLCYIPFAFLFLNFADRQGGVHKVGLVFEPGRLKDLVKFEYLVSYNHTEVLVAAFVGVLLIVMFVFSLYQRFRVRTGIHKYDGFLLAFLFGLSVFLMLPNWMLGGGALTIRLGLFVMLIMCLCTAYIPAPSRVINVAALLIYSCSLVLSCIRLNTLASASAMLEDHASVMAHIKPGSVVLPLIFETFGRDGHGAIIADKNNVFAHEGQYAGIANPVIVLDNYEANTGYFPLQWKYEVNPYVHLCRNRGIEGVPPGAAISEYLRNTGVAIDYIIMVCYDSSLVGNEDYKDLGAEIAAGYHAVYTSPSGQAVLMAKN